MTSFQGTRDFHDFAKFFTGTATFSILIDNVWPDTVQEVRILMAYDNYLYWRAQIRKKKCCVLPAGPDLGDLFCIDTAIDSM